MYENIEKALNSYMTLTRDQRSEEKTGCNFFHEAYRDLCNQLCSKSIQKFSKCILRWIELKTSE